MFSSFSTFYINPFDVIKIHQDYCVLFIVCVFICGTLPEHKDVQMFVIFKNAGVVVHVKIGFD